MDKDIPIKFKVEYREVTLEATVNNETSVEDFKKIKHTFDNLYNRYREAESQIENEKYIKAQKERENNMLANPCYNCMRLDNCMQECKGKKTCKMYVEFPF